MKSLLFATPQTSVPLRKTTDSFREALAHSGASVAVLDPAADMTALTPNPQGVHLYRDPQSFLIDFAAQARSASDFAVYTGLQPSAVSGFDAFGFSASMAASMGSGLVIVIDVVDAKEATVDALAAAGLAAAQKHAQVAGIGLLGSAQNPQVSAQVAQLAATTQTPVIDLDSPAVDQAATLARKAEEIPPAALTPSAFQAGLLEKARQDQRTIVLPEPEDERVLKAAAEVLQKGIAKLILLGNPAEIQAQAAKLGVDVSGAEIVDPADPERRERYAAKLAEIRAAKGMTIEQARETLKDVSYFGTMMIVMDEADGMVSGAIHTTAETIRPALQIIKTRPGTKMVSGAFLMLLPDHVDVYSDCAVTIDPDAEGLADIAISSAKTAAQFGLEPRVAMLSYSTGSSGSGPMVDKVIAATEAVRAADGSLQVDGPLQFDAAIDPAVGAKKMPGSPVAGCANVFIFPDLNAGNITYKAVQRNAGAIAVGPILQGLNRPVNDLSRGALVEDIVNTITITAIQAQS